MAALFHAQETLDVFQYEELWFVSLNHLHDGLKKCAARVTHSKFFPRAAKRLAREATGKHIMLWNLLK